MRLQNQLGRDTVGMISLQAARILSGYSEREVSDSAGISINELAIYEANPEMISLSLALKLLGLYKIQVDNVCFEKEK